MRYVRTVLLTASLLLSTLPAHGSPGVSRRTIRVGMHAPLTGAAPLPSETAQRGADVFWKWRRHVNEPIRGRHVEVVLKNDNYNPSQAVAVCKEMVERDRVFMLSGLMNPEGKDQIQACARYAASVNVPYVSLGTTRTGLKDLPMYFAFSRAWPAQASLLAEYFQRRLGARREKNAMVRHNTPNYEDSHDAFVAAMERRGMPLQYDRTVPKNAGQADAQTVIQELKIRDIRNVFVLTTPIWFLQLLKAADDQNYRPQWTGIGITVSTHDGVVDIGCEGDAPIRGARFLSPLPAFTDRNDFDPTYGRAMKRIYSDQGDAVSWLGWGTSRQLAKLLKRAGRHLTRDRFVRSTERARRVRTGILPALNFRPNDHYGGRAVHVLKASCRDRRWHTIERFRLSF